MKLEALELHLHRLWLPNGAWVLFSYATPVEVEIPVVGRYATNEYHSRPTSRHQAEYCCGHVVNAELFAVYLERALLL